MIVRPKARAILGVAAIKAGACTAERKEVLGGSKPRVLNLADLCLTWLGIAVAAAEGPCPKPEGSYHPHGT